MPRTWIPPLGALVVVLALGVPAGLGDWSATAIYGVLFASMLAWGILFAVTDRGDRPPQR